MNCLISAAVLITCLVSVGSALQCYTCTGAGCNDPFNQITAGAPMTCPDGVDACRKVTTTINGITTVTRTCAAPGTEIGCRTTEYTDGKVETCVCKSDLCNGPAQQCYVCAGQGCGEPFNKDTAGPPMTCPAGIDACQKVTTTANGITTVGRMCAATGTVAVGCQTTEAMGAKAETCFCKGQLCNGAKPSEETAANFSEKTSAGVALAVMATAAGLLLR